MLAKRLKFLLQADGEGQEEGRNEKRDFGQNLVIKKQVMKKMHEQMTYCKCTDSSLQCIYERVY